MPPPRPDEVTEDGGRAPRSRRVPREGEVSKGDDTDKTSEIKGGGPLISWDNGTHLRNHCQCFWTCAQMTTATRQEVLGLYRSIFRLARKWQATSGQMEDTIKEKQYILNEARTLFRKNKNLTDTDLIKQCIDECTARIEIGLHYKIPYPRPIHLPPMGLTPLQGRGLRSQEKLRKLSKPVYLRSHDEVS
ncbi:LYR motif-containing protein 1 isoform X5 [Symphalangus syndactylus]|uniref:LYR motif-containing protein 1 isoform X5 n=1 Tax=Symphalangus syndactylus TaxID=9590 RepID=UPI003007DB5D